MSKETKKTTSKTVKLTRTMRKNLETLCNNRLNWTDGGHWMGYGAEPNCNLSDKISNKISHTYHFPSDDSALRWNLDWEKKIRYAGHAVTVGLTAAVSTTFTPMAGAVVGTLAAIAKDELQAKIPYPRMARGWSYEVIYEHKFMWNPMEYSRRRGFIQTITVISRDSEGEIVHKGSIKYKFRLEDLPDGISRMIASKPSKNTSSDF